MKIGRKKKKITTKIDKFKYPSARRWQQETVGGRVIE